MTNYLKSNVKCSIIEEHVRKFPTYRNDKKNNVDIHPIYYMSLRSKLKMYERYFKSLNDPLYIKGLSTANLKRFRNRIAHPGDKPKIIRQKRDIKDLFELLKSLDEWIT